MQHWACDVARPSCMHSEFLGFGRLRKFAMELNHQFVIRCAIGLLRETSMPILNELRFTDIDQANFLAVAVRSTCEALKSYCPRA